MKGHFFFKTQNLLIHTFLSWLVKHDDTGLALAFLMWQIMANRLLKTLLLTPFYSMLVFYLPL